MDKLFSLLAAAIAGFMAIYFLIRIAVRDAILDADDKREDAKRPNLRSQIDRFKESAVLSAEAESLQIIPHRLFDTPPLPATRTVSRP